MSVSGVSTAASSWNTASSVSGRIAHKGHKPKDMTKDDLTKMETQMKADGKDTTDIDKVISNFDKLDTSKDGKVSMSELKSGADALGIKLPDGPPQGAGGANGAQQAWGPPPGFGGDSDSDSSTSTSATSSTGSSSATTAKDQIKAMLQKLLDEFSSTNPSTADSSSSSSSSSMSISA